MAVDVQDIVDVAARTVDAYREAELQILAIVAHHLEDGIDAPTWAQDRLNALVSLRRAAEAVMARLATGDPAILAAVARAARNGRGGAVLDLPGPLGDAARAAQREVPQVAAIDSIAAALIRDVGEKRRNVLRHVEDVYRQTITAAVARSVAGGITRREASQAAWQGFVDQGVTSFTDVRGRVWRLSTYVEMAVRTVTMRAAIQGQTDRLIELGQDLVIVSDELGECARCRIWEHRVLRITPGPTGTVEVESAISNDMVKVDVAGTLAEAMLAGLLHPQCGHTIRSFQPGATRIPTGPTEDPDNNDAKTRQRAIERQIRKHKEREVAGLTPEAKRAARIKVRQWQATMRQHLKDNPDLKRLPYREEIGGGNLPPGGKAPSAAGLLTGPSGGGGNGTGVDDRAARRAAARARQAEIDRRMPVADLVAEFDELLHKQAERSVFEQRLALATTTGVDQTAVATLRRALDTGDAGKIRSAITRVERKHDLTPIGRAGQTVRYDEALHEPAGDTPADGAQVVVLRQGATLDLNGETIQLSRARVTTAVVAKKTATKPEDLTHAELLGLARANGLSWITSKDNKAVIISEIRSWENANGRAILPGSAERLAAERAARVAKRAAEEARKAAAVADRARITRHSRRAADAGSRNPAVITGTTGDFFRVLQDDTGPDAVPVSNLVLDVGDGRQYTIASGQAWRIDGIVYMVEDMNGPLDPAAVMEGFRQVHATLPPDTIKHQRGYAWLARQNPADAYWEIEYKTPGFTSLATAGDGGTHVWAREWGSTTPADLAGSLRHEFGHNVSGGVHSHGMHDRGHLWADAGRRDEPRAAQVEIVSLRKELQDGHPLRTKPDPSRDYPRGVSKYGQSSPAEDFAESMRLYLAGELGTARLQPGGPVVPVYFRDIWPGRARHLDQLMPDVARKQLEALRRLGR